MSLSSTADLEDQLNYWKKKYKRLCCISIDNISGEPTWNPETDSNNDEVAFDPDTNIFYFWFQDEWHSIDIQDSGIAYQDIPHFQTEVFRDGDEGYSLTNGLMELNNPDNPLYVQKPDYSSPDPYNTLLHNNAFGTKDRFTDLNGLQVYGDGIYVDHLTKRMYCSLANAAVTWDTSIDNALATEMGGFDDWYTITFNESATLYTNTSTAAIPNFAGAFWTSTTIADATTRAAYFLPSTVAAGKIHTMVPKTSGFNTIQLKVRIFDEVDLNI
jgi:hypothetical protein